MLLLFGESGRALLAELLFAEPKRYGEHFVIREGRVFAQAEGRFHLGLHIFEYPELELAAVRKQGLYQPVIHEAAREDHAIGQELLISR